VHEVGSVEEVADIEVEEEVVRVLMEPRLNDVRKLDIER